MKYSNAMDFPDLNIDRLSNWPEEITKENSMEIYQSIAKGRHSNITEVITVAAFIYKRYGNLLWASRFGTSFTNLMNMYEENENQVTVQTILKKYGFDKLSVEQPEKRELRDKFREILKWCLVSNHAISVNMNVALNMLNSSLTHLWNDLREEIIDEITYNPEI